MQEHKSNLILEIVRLNTAWIPALHKFGSELCENSDAHFFSPHNFDIETLTKIVQKNGADVYSLLVASDVVIGYGMLRGWDEGFDIPSLGIAISPSARGCGLSMLMMNYLHTIAKLRDSKRVRLRVHNNNMRAINLYEKLGYVLENDKTKEGYLVGYKDLNHVN